MIRGFLTVLLFGVILVLERKQGFEEGKKQGAEEVRAEYLKQKPSYDDVRQVAVECLHREAERLERCAPPGEFGDGR